ncbi:MAG TPA: hypothetical protein VNT03_06060 [Baekduia sp.]|nr:hypothetical protein [Baekduia sp.]
MAAHTLIVIALAVVILTAAFAPTAGAATASAAARAAYHRADAAVIAAAQKVVSCERAKSAATRACTERRARLQAAGVKLSRLQRSVAATAKAASSLSWRQSAPTLSVSGSTLTWSKVADVTSYVLVAKVAGQTDRYSVITGLSTTPAAQPGKTVTYAVRTAIVGSAWSREAKIAYAAPTAPAAAPSTDRLAAPKLVLDGQTVRWTKVADVNDYYYVVKVPGVADAYKSVTGTSVTPTPVPGQTIRVSVRTAVDGSNWAPEVSITYPASAPTTPTTPPATGGTGTTAPSTSTNFQVGVVSGSAINWELPFVTSLGAKSARMEFDINTPAADLAQYVDAYAKAGIQPLLMAGFQGRTPTAAEGRNLATWAAAYGPGGTFWAGKGYSASTAVTRIEFGNESNQSWQYPTLASDPNWANTTFYANLAQGYAASFKAAGQAITAVNGKVGLLAIGDTPGNWATWMNNIYKAVPDFSSYVAGWVMHPYGPASRWQPTMDNALAQVAAHGAPSTIPIYVTEYGIASDNGRCLDDNYGWDKCMTYDQAGVALRDTVAAMRARYGSRLAAMYLYQAHDQKSPGASVSRESYFGGLALDGTAKGTYTSAMKTLLSSNA